MADNSIADIEIVYPVPDDFGDFCGRAHFIAFRDDDQAEEFFAPRVFEQQVRQPIHIHIYFRDDHAFRATPYRRVQGDITGVASHHFDEKQAIVGICGIPDAVNRFYGRVHRRIKADGVVGTVQVIVNRTRNPYERNVVFLGKNIRPGEGTIAPYADAGINIESGEGFESGATSLRLHEALATGRFEDGAPPMDDVRNIFAL